MDIRKPSLQPSSLPTLSDEQLLENINQMESALNQCTLDVNERTQYRVKLKKYRLRIQARLLKAQPKTIDSPASIAHEQKQRETLLTQYHLLQTHNDRLTDTWRVAVETEQLGTHTLEQLQRQRQQLERTDHALDKTEAEVMLSQVRLKRMLLRRRRMYWSIAAGVVILVSILIGILVWWFLHQS